MLNREIKARGKGTAKDRTQEQEAEIKPSKVCEERNIL